MGDFSPKGNRYDLSTFYGRFRHFVDITNPISLLASEKDILEAQKKISTFESTGHSGDDANEKMWEYKRTVDATVHPALGTIVPTPFRVCAIAAVNIPIVYAMLAFSPSQTALQLSAHFVNQSYNTACNYSNRAGAHMSNEEIFKAYSLAVGSACVFAFGLGQLFKFAPPALQALSPMVPFISTSAANVSNITLTRLSEIKTGIPLKDSENNERGMSKIAGLKGVYQSALSRCVMVPAATLLVPPAIMAVFRRVGMVPRNRRAALLMELGTIFACLQFAIPAALAVFPQTLTLRASDLEPEFRDLKDTKGRAVEFLTANKGL